jgi:hypothetical protein
VVKAGTGRKEFLMDALHSEMVACLMGVQAAAEMRDGHNNGFGWQHIPTCGNIRHCFEI